MTDANANVANPDIQIIKGAISKNFSRKHPKVTKIINRICGDTVLYVFNGFVSTGVSMLTS